MAVRQQVTTGVLVLWLILLTVFSIVSRTPRTIAEDPAAEDSVLARVLKSGKIRASYAVAAPLCLKDPNTGDLSGVSVDILEEAARRLQLQVDWVEEVGWGSLFEGLQADRYDIFGAGVWRNSSRGRAGVFSNPIFFNVIKVWGRPGEDRFSSIESLNSLGLRIATQDGGMDSLIASSDFPNAKQVSTPQISNYSDVLLNVVSKKADLTLADPTLVAAFLATNPDSLIELFPNRPLRVFPTCFPMRFGAYGFQSMIDSALIEMQGDGSIERILRKYEGSSAQFYRVATPFRAPSALLATSQSSQ